MSEYIPITEIKGENINANLLDIEDQLNECINIYQLQSQKNSDHCSIVKVGIMQETSDVLITNFDLFGKYKCYFVSKIYDIKGLKDIENTATFEIIKILICNNNNLPIAKLCYNFHTFVHLQDNKSITEYMSELNNLIKLKGHYTITLHFREKEKDKYIKLNSSSVFIGHDCILEELTKWLLDENVQQLLYKLT